MFLCQLVLCGGMEQYTACACHHTDKDATVLVTAVIEAKQVRMIPSPRNKWTSRCKVTRQMLYTTPRHRKRHKPGDCNFWCRVIRILKSNTVCGIYLTNVPVFLGKQDKVPHFNMTGMFYRDQGQSSGIPHSIQIGKDGIVQHIWKGHELLPHPEAHIFELPQQCFMKLPQKVQTWLRVRRRMQLVNNICAFMLCYTGHTGVPWRTIFNNCL